MVARIALVLAFAAVASTVACSAGPDSAKKPLPVCDAKDPECPGVPASSSGNRAKSDTPETPVKTPEPETTLEPTPEPTSPDAGVDAAPVPGKYCQVLSKCCDDLASAGFNTTTCKSVLSTNNEDACYTQHAVYKNGGECV